MMIAVTEFGQDEGQRSIMPDLKRVLVPVSNLEEAKLLMPLAEVFLQPYQAELTILLIAIAPRGRPLSETAAEASRGREAFCRWLSGNTQITASVKTMVCPRTDVWVGIWGIIEQGNVDLLLLGSAQPGLGETVLNRIIEPRLAALPCDVAAVRLAKGVIDESSWESVKRILLPMRGRLQSALTLQMGCALAASADAEVTLLRVTSPGNHADPRQFQEAFRKCLDGSRRITRLITAKGDVFPTIQKEMVEHQAIVMGAPNGREGDWMKPLLDVMIADIDVSLVIVKEGTKSAAAPNEVIRSAFSRPSRPVAMVVDKWFAENTYHSREFADLERLVALKEEQEVTISLGLPALNEEKTVGNVIQTVKHALMDEIPLLDEVILIDSNSSDSTREIAEDLGVRVYVHQEILPQHGTYDGKGEALWKSLYVLEGDLIAWIDTDIKNIHPRFVYGVLGPLLRDPGIQYVKGFYRRPLKQGDKILAGGGGRVTELTARPFFNLFFPELSGLIQPLSGEYAGRRSALERLPFFSGYGVETGLLIDILRKYGLSAIAQTDLLERIHHNQPLPSLSKMSFAIMQVVISRLEKENKVELLQEANLTMNLIRYRPRRRYFLEPEQIKEHERPAMTTVKEYRDKNDLSKQGVRGGVGVFESIWQRAGVGY